MPPMYNGTPLNSVGIVTTRDNFTIHWSQEEVWSTINEFASLSTEKASEVIQSLYISTLLLTRENFLFLTWICPFPIRTTLLKKDI